MVYFLDEVIRLRAKNALRFTRCYCARRNKSKKIDSVLKHTFCTIKVYKIHLPNGAAEHLRKHAVIITFMNLIVEKRRVRLPFAVRRNFRCVYLSARMNLFKTKVLGKKPALILFICAFNLCDMRSFCFYLARHTLCSSTS